MEIMMVFLAKNSGVGNKSGLPNQPINADGNKACGLAVKVGWPAGYGNRWATNISR